MDDPSRARELFVTGLKNAHAMERQALSIMKPQLDRVENYPDVAAILRQHIAETEGQQARLEHLLEGIGESPSMLKDAGLSIAGATASLSHAMAGDEVVKNSFANFAFEHYEIAAYRALITLATAAGETAAIEPLRDNLAEEEAMARRIEDSLEPVTERFIALAAGGEPAKR